MKIILSGGGSGEDSKELDEFFVKLLNKEKPLLYIPIAIDKQKHPYPSCLDWLKKTFEKYWINSYLMLTEENFEKFLNVNVKDYSGIYIGGGNTPYLLKELKKMGFWKVLQEAVSEDIPIYGGSAGAIIFAKTIIPSLYHDKNEVGLTSFDGMNILEGRDISCHYKNGEDIFKIVTENSLSSVIALTQKNGIFVSENKIKLLGQESAWIFEKGKKTRKEFRVGEEIIL